MRTLCIEFVRSNHLLTLKRVHTFTSLQVELCNPVNLNLQHHTVYIGYMLKTSFVKFAEDPSLVLLLILSFKVMLYLFSMALGFLGMHFFYKEDHHHGYKSGQMSVVSLSKFPFVQSLKTSEYKDDLCNKDPR